VKINKTVIIFSAIFILALILRFLYFPSNIYFGYDQARDAFMSQQIAHGKLTVTGPSTSLPGLFHGPLYWYLIGPIYLLSGGNPIGPSIFLRIANVLALFLVFKVASILFNKKTALMSCFLFAISFEQTQFAIYFTHPALAVLSVMIFYLGGALLFFKQDKRGLILLLLGLGLSVQFNFVLNYLVLPLVACLVIFHKSLKSIPLKTALIAAGAFALSVSTFIAAEIKYHFRTINALIASLHQPKLPKGWDPSITQSTSLTFTKSLPFINARLVHDNLLNIPQLVLPLSIFLLICLALLLRKKALRPKLIYLFIWFAAGSLPYIKDTSTNPIYFYSVGASISLLIFVAFLLTSIPRKFMVISTIALVVILASNLQLVSQTNPQGSLASIDVQTGMLLCQEKKVVDYTYQKAEGRPFAINALSNPAYVDTTWSYLYEWYGKKKYGYLPVWGGRFATGYPGNLAVQTARTKLPADIFLIIESTHGLHDSYISSFIQEENYFTKISASQKYGDIQVQKRYSF